MQLESLCLTHTICCGQSINFSALLVLLPYCMFDSRDWSRGFSLLCFGLSSDGMTAQRCEQRAHWCGQKPWIHATITLDNHKWTMLWLHEIDDRVQTRPRNREQCLFAHSFRSKRMMWRIPMRLMAFVAEMCVARERFEDLLFETVCHQLGLSYGSQTVHLTPNQCLSWISRHEMSINVILSLDTFSLYFLWRSSSHWRPHEFQG
jgi:hypothetical protein